MLVQYAIPNLPKVGSCRWLRSGWLIMLFLGANHCYSQLDTLHVFPPVCALGYLNMGTLYLSTPDSTPVPFTISDPLGNVLDSGSVSNVQNYPYDMWANTVNHPVAINNQDRNSILTGKGLIVRSQRPVLANLRMESGCQAFLNSGTLWNAGINKSIVVLKSRVWMPV